jgi:hypothetical protein
MLEELLERDVNFVFISALPPFTVSRLKKLILKVHARIPKSRIGTGLWGFGGNSEVMKTHLKMADADSIVTTLAEAVSQMALVTERLGNEATALPAAQHN